MIRRRGGGWTSPHSATATTAPRTRHTWTTGVAFAALAVPALVVSQLLADPKAHEQMYALAAIGTWLTLPYAVLALVAWRGSPRAAGWIALGLGGPVVLALVAALVLGGDDALGLAVYFAPAIGLTLALLVACQLGLVVGGIAILRATAAGARPFALAMACALAVGVIASANNTRLYRRSPERRAAVALHQAVAAQSALLQTQRCLWLHQRAHGTYPASLAALGAAGDRCLPDAPVAGFTFDYLPRADRAGYELRAIAGDPAVRESYSRASDETGMIYMGPVRRDDQEPLPGMVREIVMEIDLCLEQYRLAHPAKGYPSSLAAPDAEGFACFRDSGLGERMRSVVTIGETEGYRYRYAPAPVDPAGRITSFRLDVRPAVYGRGFRQSLLCTPEGSLHMTEEDRPAEHGDRDEQVDEVTGEVQRRYCLGPDAPARR